MKLTFTTRFNIGDKVIWNEEKTPYTIRDIVLTGSINSICEDYIIQRGNKVILAFESELIPAKRR